VARHRWDRKGADRFTDPPQADQCEREKASSGAGDIRAVAPQSDRETDEWTRPRENERGYNAIRRTRPPLRQNDRIRDERKRGGRRKQKDTNSSQRNEVSIKKKESSEK